MTHTMRLPYGWGKATLPELVGANGILTDGDWVESKDQDPNGDVRLTQLADIGDGVFRDRSCRFMTSEKAVELGCTYLRKDDVMIARMPDPLGRSCLFPGIPMPCVTVVDVCMVRPGINDISNRWLMHTINAPDIRSSVAQLQSGSTRKRISKKNLCTIELPVPPTNEQHRIVGAIESYLTRLDDAVASLKRVEHNLKRYHASVLKAAVEGRLVPTEAELAKKEGRSYEPASELLKRILVERRKKWIENAAEKARANGEKKAREAGNPWTHANDVKMLEKERAKAAKKYKEPAAPDTSNLPNLPEGWRYMSVDEFSSGSRNAIKRGPFGSTLRKEFFVPNGVKVYEQQHAINNDFSLGHYYISQEKFETLRPFQVKPGDIVISCSGTIGRVAIVPETAEPGIINQALLKLSLDERIIVNGYFKAVFTSLSRRAVASTARGSGMQNFAGVRELKKVGFPMPPIQEQERILLELDRYQSVIQMWDVSIDRALQRCQKLRQSILKWAFEGKLVEQDPNDEPASVLLERIKAERESMQPHKTRRTIRKKKDQLSKHDKQLDLLGGSDK